MHKELLKKLNTQLQFAKKYNPPEYKRMEKRLDKMINSNYQSLGSTALVTIKRIKVGNKSVKV